MTDGGTTPRGTAGHEERLAAEAAALVAEAARFAGLGWMRATSGNLSVVLGREPLRLAVTGSGGDKGELTVRDIVEAVDWLCALVSRV
ncbi:class II aldolase/adducin family protein [Pseudofrankia sp. BMG5.37]|nr:class II aldolase/adducin family protein [Pseudofrankia sp. BMG5.37]MDT3438794.1 class II aldolase/adducin family protein [Pseudofrankia sp. BMG5.37]